VTTGPAISPGLARGLWVLMALTLLVNAASMLTPIINEGDSVLYAALAQHMLQSGDYLSLVLDGKDWLDKPHFPFWIGALFFKLFGISAGSYILPGFVFHVLGGYYTYRLARTLYGRDAALLALLVYLSTYHLMYTTSALKAEAFLNGSVMGACYYCVRLDATGRTKHLLLAAMFSACALMTKGVFTLLTIGSGMFFLWLYQGRLTQLLRLRWWLMLALTLLCTAPELGALYWQFDAHPEKTVFGQQGVSGIRFFFWDSQFGRFFNSGPITNEGGNPWYFVHVFLWAFLPWVAAFGGALWAGLRSFAHATVGERDAFVYLCASFFVSFVMFSATAFQLDYYTVIVYPFAAIVCGRFLLRCLPATAGGALWIGQLVCTLLTLGLGLGVALQVGDPGLLTLSLSICALVLLAVWRLRLWRRAGVLLVLPVLAVNILYASLEGMTYIAHTRYSVPFNVLPVLASSPSTQVLVYGLDPTVAWEIGLYRRSAPSLRMESMDTVNEKPKDYFLLIKTEVLPALGTSLGAYRVVHQGQWVDHKTGLLPRQINLAKGAEPSESFSVLRVGPAL
jgi:4-amino-4-deoxy-L-arabinose transferase-like glycosyltransferase